MAKEGIIIAIGLDYHISVRICAPTLEDEPKPIIQQTSPWDSEIWVNHRYDILKREEKEFSDLSKKNGAFTYFPKIRSKILGGDITLKDISDEIWNIHQEARKRGFKLRGFSMPSKLESELTKTRANRMRTEEKRLSLFLKYTTEVEKIENPGYLSETVDMFKDKLYSQGLTNIFNTKVYDLNQEIRHESVLTTIAGEDCFLLENWMLGLKEFQ